MTAAMVTVRVAVERLGTAARTMGPRWRAAVAGPTARLRDSIVTERMTIRPFRPGDCVEFLRVVRLNRAHLSRFFPLSRGVESDLEVFARELRLSAGAGEGAARGDWRRAAFSRDGRLIGCFNLNGITHGLVFRAETTFWVSREFAGRGYAREGLGAVLEHAFADPVPSAAGGVETHAGADGRAADAAARRTGGLGLHRIDAFVDVENAASVRVLTALGFARHEPNVRLALSVGGRSRPHDLYTRHIALPALPVLEFKFLPADLRAIIGPQIAAIVDADPVGELARAVA
jgi:ribosomal-protein-alanine N-acetyltransferase